MKSVRRGERHTNTGNTKMIMTQSELIREAVEAVREDKHYNGRYNDEVAYTYLRDHVAGGWSFEVATEEMLAALEDRVALEFESENIDPQRLWAWMDSR